MEEPWLRMLGAHRYHFFPPQWQDPGHLLRRDGVYLFLNIWDEVGTPEATLDQEVGKEPGC